MCKNNSFAVATTMLMLTMILWATYGTTKADKIVVTHRSLMADAYLGSGPLDPVW